MNHYPAFICENGHAVSTCSETCQDKFCKKCGARIISNCPNCKTTIRGIGTDDLYGLLVKFPVPAYCPTCGKPYPWTAAAIEATMYMLQESDLPVADQAKIIESLPDMISETPRTQLAAVRYKKAIAVGGFIAEGLRDFAVNFGSEAFKNLIGLP